MRGRVIYIKNPKEGSHFRTIGGSPGPKSKPRPKPRPQGGGSSSQGGGGGSGTIPDDPFFGTYLQGYQTPEDWYQADQPTSLTGYTQETGEGTTGTGPYIQEWGLAPYEYAEQISGLLGAGLSLAQLISMILQGIDPASGQIILPYGTPGTLVFGSGTEWTSVQDESEAHLSGQQLSTGIFGTIQDSLNLIGAYGINPSFLNQKPKNKKKG